jgi:hypothetical protein
MNQNFIYHHSHHCSFQFRRYRATEERKRSLWMRIHHKGDLCLILIRFLLARNWISFFYQRIVKLFFLFIFLHSPQQQKFQKIFRSCRKKYWAVESGKKAAEFFSIFFCSFVVWNQRRCSLSAWEIAQRYFGVDFFVLKIIQIHWMEMENCDVEKQWGNWGNFLSTHKSTQKRAWKDEMSWTESSNIVVLSLHRKS